jgi:hypothetical protein
VASAVQAAEEKGNAIKEQALLASLAPEIEVDAAVDVSEFGSDVGEIYSDIVFEVENVRINAHRVVVFARCAYLRGLVSMLERQATAATTAATDEGAATAVTTSAADDEKITPLVVPIEGVRQAVFQALLMYVYTDRIEVPPHMLTKLAELADEYGLGRLRVLCERRKERASMLHLSDRPAAAPVTPPPPSSFGTEMLQALKAGVQAGVRESRAEARAEVLAQAQAQAHHAMAVNGSSARPLAHAHAPVITGVQTSFKMQTGVLACADVCFLLPSSSLSSRENLSADTSATASQTTKIWAHRVILCRSEYFRVLLSGKFREGSQRVLDLRPLIEGHNTTGDFGSNDPVAAAGSELGKLELESHLQAAAAATGAAGAGAEDVTHERSGMQEQGLSGWCFVAILQWAYTGSRAMVRKLAEGKPYDILDKSFGEGSSGSSGSSVAVGGGVLGGADGARVGAGVVGRGATEGGEQKQEEEEEAGDGARQVMELLVAAVQTGFEDLAQCCEQVLANMLSQNPSFENLEACRSFADQYGMARLLKQSCDLMELVGAEHLKC